MPESKEEVKPTAIMGYVKRTQEHTKRPPNVQSENNFSKNKVVLGCNPNYKISVCEPITYLKIHLILDIETGNKVIF